MKAKNIVISLLLIIASVFLINEIRNLWNGSMQSMSMNSHNMNNMDMNNMQMSNKSMGHESNVELKSSKGLNEISFPTILQPDKRTGKNVEYTLKAQQGKTPFYNGTYSDTYGYNGSLLGPVIMLNKGEQVKMNLMNQLKKDTTVHWHGLEVNGDVDGGPDEVIQPGKTRVVNFKVDQNESTLWFHPHPHESTTSQVYKGLSGLLYIKDDVKRSIPNQYGIDDLPIIIQDKTFKDNQLVYEKIKNADGTKGQEVVINGTVNPKLTVKNNEVRLRLLNGSNARSLELKMSNNMEFKYIASDGGYLKRPIKLTKIKLAPGERKEILLNINQAEGQKVNLIDGNNTIILPIQSKSAEKNYPPQIDLGKNKFEKIKYGKISKTIKLAGMGKMVSINNEQFDPKKINLKQKVNTTEIWDIENVNDHMGGMKHPFHIHGTQFRVLSIDGKDPGPEFSGYKDTISINPGQKARIAVKFNHKGVFMYHCHILEHEENGMMGQLKVY